MDEFVSWRRSCLPEPQRRYRAHGGLPCRCSCGERDERKPQFTLVELLIVAAAQAWRDDGEVLARVSASCRAWRPAGKLDPSPELMMTDSEAFSGRRADPRRPPRRLRAQIQRRCPSSACLNVRVGGKRHDWSADPDRPLWPRPTSRASATTAAQGRDAGVRGLPGNSINHINSFFVPSHSPACSWPARWDMALRRRLRRSAGLMACAAT